MVRLLLRAGAHLDHLADRGWQLRPDRQHRQGALGVRSSNQESATAPLERQCAPEGPLSARSSESASALVVDELAAHTDRGLFRLAAAVGGRG